jgi:hypothetical protein
MELIRRTSVAFVLAAILVPSIFASSVGASTSTKGQEKKAAHEYVLAYHHWIVANNATINRENSSSPSVSEAGWKADITAYQNFDKALLKIKFPKLVQPEVQILLNANAQLESYGGDAAVNTNNTSVYNSILSQFESEDAKFTAADHVIREDLRISN